MAAGGKHTSVRTMLDRSDATIAEPVSQIPRCGPDCYVVVFGAYRRDAQEALCWRLAACHGAQNPCRLACRWSCRGPRWHALFYNFSLPSRTKVRCGKGWNRWYLALPILSMPKPDRALIGHLVLDAWYRPRRTCRTPGRRSAPHRCCRASRRSCSGSAPRAVIAKASVGR